MRTTQDQEQVRKATRKLYESRMTTDKLTKREGETQA